MQRQTRRRAMKLLRARGAISIASVNVLTASASEYPDHITRSTRLPASAMRNHAAIPPRTPQIVLTIFLGFEVCCWIELLRLFDRSWIHPAGLGDGDVFGLNKRGNLKCGSLNLWC